MTDPPQTRRVIIECDTGLMMKCLMCEPVQPSVQPFVLFVHGSMHGDWCWAEHWMPFLGARGIGSAAVNLRGTEGARPPPEYNGGRKVVQLDDLVKVPSPSPWSTPPPPPAHGGTQSTGSNPSPG